MRDGTTEPDEYRPEQDDWEEDRSPDEGQAGAEERGYPVDDAHLDYEPDVLLDVPTLKVDEINLEVENLRARVSLQAEVLDLLKLNVGADVALGRVSLGIKGVEAEALLKVRLNNVARILDRVMTTIDENPEILQSLARGLGSAVEDVGAGTGRAVEDVGEGAGAAIEDVGRGAGGAVEDVGEVAEDVGTGGGRAAEEAGSAAGGSVRDVGRGAGDTVEDSRRTASTAGQNVGDDRAGAAETSRQQAKRAARPGRAVRRGSQRPYRRGRQVRPRTE